MTYPRSWSDSFRKTVTDRRASKRWWDRHFRDMDLQRELLLQGRVNHAALYCYIKPPRRSWIRRIFGRKE